MLNLFNPVRSIEIITECLFFWRENRKSSDLFLSRREALGSPCCFNVRTYESLSLSDAKRLIGRKYDEESVQSDVKHWPFKVS